MGWGGGVFWKSGPEREGISWNVLVESLNPEEGMSGMGLRSALGNGRGCGKRGDCTEGTGTPELGGDWPPQVLCGFQLGVHNPITRQVSCSGSLTSWMLPAGHGS